MFCVGAVPGICRDYNFRRYIVNNGQGRDGPGIERGAEERPGKPPRPLSHQPSESDGAIPYVSPLTGLGQAVDATDCNTNGDGSAFALPLLWDTGCEQNGLFRVRTRVFGAVDGGLRRRWVERLLFADSSSIQEEIALEGPKDPQVDGSAGVLEPSLRKRHSR